jgi:hypothetical protein
MNINSKDLREFQNLTFISAYTIGKYYEFEKENHNGHCWVCRNSDRGKYSGITEKAFRIMFDINEVIDDDIILLM